MNRASFTCLFIWFSFLLNAQRYDYQWIVSKPSTWNNFKISKFDFTTDPMFVHTLDAKDMDYANNVVSVADSAGNFIFLGNGFRVYDKNFEVMPNGNGLTLGYNYSATGGSNWWLPAYFAINWPDNPKSFAIIQQKGGFDTLPTGVVIGYGKEIQYSKVDMTMNNGLGDVSLKNEKIFSGTIVKTAACKHSNGRDWWVLGLDAYFREYVIALLSPAGVQSVERYQFGQEIVIPYDTLGWIPSDINDVGNVKTVFTSFDQKGTKFLFSNGSSGIFVFDFDRCSGQLGNYIRLEQPWWSVPEWATFSPNGRFVYSVGAFAQGGGLPVFYRYYQFDLWADDPQESMTVVVDMESYDHPLYGPDNGVAFPMLAPDGKMYISTGLTDFHSIEFPNRKGLNSKFVKERIKLPNYHLIVPQNYYPNYRLGPIDGSPCDTLGLDNHPLAHFRWDIEDTLAPYTVTFTDLAAYEPATWSWDFDGLGMSSDTSPVFTFPGAGVYEVCQTVCNVNSCDTVCKTVVLGMTSASNDEFRMDGSFSVFPNPVGDVLYVRPVGAREAGASRYRFALHDVAGQLVFQREMSVSASGVQFSLAHLPKGLYFYEIKSASGAAVQVGKVVRL